jgi:hypothetical protein
MTAELADAVAKPSRIPALVEELILQISANSLQDKTVKEAESLLPEQRKELARTLFRYNPKVALIYNTLANCTLGPASEKPYRV